MRKAEREGLYHKLIAQLEKDFSLANVSMPLGEEIAPEELAILLKEKLYVLLMEKFDEYLNLLYIIDVPEKALAKMTAIDAVDVSQHVTYLVLKREFQKVFLKNKYGS